MLNKSKILDSPFILLFTVSEAFRKWIAADFKLRNLMGKDKLSVSIVTHKSIP